MFLPEFEFHKSEGLGKLNVSKHGGLMIAVRSEFDSRRINLDSEILGATVAWLIIYHNSDSLLVFFYSPPEHDGKPNSYHLSTEKVICTIKEVIEIGKFYRSTVLYGDFNLKVDCNDYSTNESEDQQILDINHTEWIPTNCWLSHHCIGNSRSSLYQFRHWSSNMQTDQSKFSSNHNGIDFKLQVATLQEDYLGRATQPRRNLRLELLQSRLRSYATKDYGITVFRYLLEQHKCPSGTVVWVA